MESLFFLFEYIFVHDMSNFIIVKEKISWGRGTNVSGCVFLISDTNLQDIYAMIYDIIEENGRQR